MKSNLSIFFSFITCALSVISKNLLPNSRSWIFVLMLYSRHFRVLALPFRSLVNFELTLYMLWDRNQTSFFYTWISSFPSICWKAYTFFHWIVWIALPKTINVRVYFWNLNFVPWIFTSIFMPLSHCPAYYCSFVVSTEIKKTMNLSFFQNHLSYSESLVFP